MHPNYYCILSLIITAFISFSFLSVRRILFTIISFSLYRGAQSPVHNAPIISYFFYMGVHNRQCTMPLLFLISFILSLIFSFYILRHIQWSVRRTFGCEQTHIFCSTKFVVTWLEIFDNMLFNWAIINFFLIEYYVRAYWISYV